jgi:surface polysaccharide O-acyltransferase-like enzyme
MGPAVPRTAPPDSTDEQPAAPPRVTDEAAAAAAAARSPEQLAFTSYLRVAAMSAVVLIHTVAGIVSNPAIRGSLTWWGGTALDLGVSWSVPTFIMVSGALVLAPRSREGAMAFYRRRLDRIAIPLVVAHVGYFAVRARLQHEHLTAAVVIRDVLRANVYPHLYFFWIILGLYLVTPLLRAIVSDRTRNQVLVIGSAAVGWMCLVAGSARVLHITGGAGTPWQPPALTLWIPYLGYFILGYALRDLVLNRRWLLVALAVFVVADFLVIWHYAVGARNPVANVLLGGGYQGLPVAASVIALFLIARSVMHPGARLARPHFAIPMRRLGDLTLGVFVIHFLVMRYAWKIPGLAYAQIKVDLGRSLVLFLIVLAVSFLICAVIARIPVARRAIGL